jgi:hypothetical protein
LHASDQDVPSCNTCSDSLGGDNFPHLGVKCVGIFLACIHALVSAIEKTGVLPLSTQSGRRNCVTVRNASETSPLTATSRSVFLPGVGTDPEKPPVTPQPSVLRNFPWGALVVVALGGLLLFLGTWRFHLRHHFGLVDALHCGMAIIPAGLLLLVSDYVLHHAKLVLPMPLILAGILIRSSPAFDVAIGLVLAGAVAGPLLREWQDKRRDPQPSLTGAPPA